MSDYNFYEVEKAFTEAMAQAGIPPAEGVSLRLDGKKHRYKVAGDKAAEKSGEYCCYVDEHPAGYFKSYKASHGVEYEAWAFRSENWQSMSPAERKAYIAQKEEEKARRDAEKALVRADAIKKAQAKWDAATPANPTHNYALKKGLHSVHGARLLGNKLLIPYRNGEGEIVTVQTIASDGTKRFQLNAPKLGCFSVLSVAAVASEGEEKGKTSEEAAGDGMTKRIWIGEGWATCCSVQEATEETVIVAADCGNLLPVAKTVRELWPSHEFVIAADNDAVKGAGNPGLDDAIKVWEELGIPYVFPVFNDDEKAKKLTDWNDFAASRGLDQTKAAMLFMLDKAKNSVAYVERGRYPNFIHVNASNGRPKGTIENLEVLLKFLNVRCEYDEIKKEPIIEIPNRKYCGDNSMNASLGYVLSRCAEYGFPKSDVDPFIVEISARNVINPVRDWIMSAPWDGVPRVQTVCDSLECDEGFDNVFKDVLIKKWLVSAVAAVCHERFKCRGVLVLCGPQGLGKTTWFKVLSGASDWFAEGLTLDPADKDSVKKAISHWIVELGELEATFKRADLARLKAFITSDRDVLRLPWGHRMSEFARRTVYCGTVNQREILLDPTGNSRWWCIPVRKITLLDADEMQQVWAEAAVMYKDGMQWWLTSEEEANLTERNWEFEAPDPVEDLIRSKLAWAEDGDTRMYEWKTSAEVLELCGVQNPAQQRGLCMKASQVLTKITGKKSVRAANTGARVFFVPDKKLRGTMVDSGHIVTGGVT